MANRQSMDSLSQPAHTYHDLIEEVKRLKDNQTQFLTCQVKTITAADQLLQLLRDFRLTKDNLSQLPPEVAFDNQDDFIRETNNILVLPEFQDHLYPALAKLAGLQEQSSAISICYLELIAEALSKLKANLRTELVIYVFNWSWLKIIIPDDEQAAKTFLIIWTANKVLQDKLNRSDC